MPPGRIVIVSGEKGAGKTLHLERLAVAARSDGRRVGGVLAPAVFESEERVGYDLIELDTGRRMPLARIATSASSVPRTGPYAFRTEAVAAGQAAIKAAVERSDIIVIDEIGPLEFEGQGWAAPLQVALAEGVAGQELLLAVRPSLVDRLAERFPSTAWGAAECVSPAAGG